MELKYFVIDGLSIYERDINLGPAGTVPKTRQELLGRGDGPRYGVVIDGSGYRWAGGVVPFDISPSFDATQRQYIFDAMAHIDATTATQFVQRTTEAAYVYFDLDSGCNSPVGRQGGYQEINLTWDFCSSDPSHRMGVAAHEILHSLGFWHEQSRCDRDTYITIHWNNIPDWPGYREANYGKKCSGNSDYFAYAEGSIMHYAAVFNGVQEISSLRGLDYLMGQRSGLHQTDMNTINHVYQPYGVWPVSISNSGGTPLISWTAYAGGSSYSVRLVVIYEEVNGYENWSTIYEEPSMGGSVGTTAGLSLQDSQRAYTGMSECYLWNEWYGYARYVYKYEILAHYPDGPTSKPARYDAPVGPC